MSLTRVETTLSFSSLVRKKQYLLDGSGLPKHSLYHVFSSLPFFQIQTPQWWVKVGLILFKMSLRTVPLLLASAQSLRGENAVIPRYYFLICDQIILNDFQMVSSIFHPFDHHLSEPELSPNGKYIFRMHFNGCFRKVIIDDRLPASRNEQTLHVMDRNNPGLLWPALVEKAYLKVRGGYDFPGSNSGTDIWVLTSWIPEQIFLQRYGFVPQI